MKKLFLPFALCFLSACTQSPSTVRITQDLPSQVPPERKLAVAKSEPVFYNGKTYRVDLSPDAAGTYLVAVSGMTEAQEKDAVGLVKSAFHHFTCKDSQSTRFLTKPAFAANQWNVIAKCG